MTTTCLNFTKKCGGCPLLAMPYREQLAQKQARLQELLGGFAPVEATRAAAAGLRSVTLGPRILRTETAALAALTIVQYARGDMGRCVGAVKN